MSGHEGGSVQVWNFLEAVGPFMRHVDFDSPKSTTTLKESQGLPVYPPMFFWKNQTETLVCFMSELGHVPFL